MKKLYHLFLALIATTPLWAVSFEVDGIAYNILGGDSVEVTFKSPKYTDTIIIPSYVTYESTYFDVTGIGNSAFLGCDSLSSVTIPQSVTSIGLEAFSGCKSLSAISIPSSVTRIGNYAFNSCSSLSSINIDAANTHYISIDGVLFNFVKDTLIQYPVGNKRSKYAIPSSVTRIEGYSFKDCVPISSIHIPSSVISIGEYAFSYCTSLSSIDVDATNTHYASVDGVLFNYAKDTLIQYPIGNIRTEYIIPFGVTHFGNGAFSYCTTLSSVTIPPSATSIGLEAFLLCTSLSSITIPNSVTSIRGAAFRDCTSLSSITIPNSVTSFGNAAFYGCSSLNAITFGNNVTNIGHYAFYDCKSLTSITCYATTPPTCGDYCFTNVDKSIPLYVPVESKNAYEAAYGWWSFTNIQTIITGLQDVFSSEEKQRETVKVIKDGKVIILHNDKTYNAQGAEL